MNKAFQSALAAVAVALSLPSIAANDRFFKEAPNSNNGFEPASDPTYRKECGSCHTAYLPGLFPARSWELHMKKLDKHFGEVVTLPPATHEHIRSYLVDHAADKSRFEGSLTMMERIDPARTPYRFRDMPLFLEMHRVVMEVIDRRAKIKVRNTTNCQTCHQMAEEGSFGNSELFIPGLTPSRTRSGAPK